MIKTLSQAKTASYNMLVKKLFFIIPILLLLSGCVIRTLESRYVIAEKIATSAQMKKRNLRAGLFNLTSWEKITNPSAVFNIYIEGDGLAWLSKYKKSPNPTPPEPMALKLATLDPNYNVIYIARPCQYSTWVENGACPNKYWTEARTSAEVIDSYQIALDHIKSIHKARNFNLIAFSGGAAVAALVAAERDDVLSIRTIAGNLDYSSFTKLHKISPMTESIDPVTVAEKISDIPQMHFIGSDDKVVPIDVFYGWKRAAKYSSCIGHYISRNTDHEHGWVENWPDLIGFKPACTDNKD